MLHSLDIKKRKRPTPTYVPSTPSKLITPKQNLREHNPVVLKHVTLKVIVAGRLSDRGIYKVENTR